MGKVKPSTLLGVDSVERVKSGDASYLRERVRKEVRCIVRIGKLQTTNYKQ